jgi:hypothetical protein
LRKEQIIATISHQDINYIEILSKNYPQVSLFHYSSLAEESEGIYFRENDLDEQHHIENFHWYLLIKAADLFYQKRGRYPGQTLHSKFEEDIPLFQNDIEEYLVNSQNPMSKRKENLPEILIHNPIKFEFVHEFCRNSNSKLVPSISIISSIASQEIIKLITYQFKTINNTVIFDGIHSTLSTFKL